MSVYVDNARLEWRGMKMSHLQADSDEELHVFAARLGLRRGWHQPGSRPEASHYDVSDSVRLRAIKLGAIEETVGEGSTRRRSAREALGEDAVYQGWPNCRCIGKSQYATEDDPHGTFGPPGGMGW